VIYTLDTNVLVDALRQPPELDRLKAFLSWALPSTVLSSVVVTELTAGARIFYPVFAPGALFEAGDGHAGQGNGEVDITALETFLTGTFQFILHKGEATREQLNGDFRTRNLGRFLLAGKTQPVSIHEVLGVDSHPGEELPWVIIFDTAVRNYTERRFDEADHLFRQVIKLRGGQDGPSEFYLKQITAARMSAPSAESGWDGIIVFQSK